MNLAKRFHLIDRVIRVAFATFFASAVLTAVVCCTSQAPAPAADAPSSSTTGTLRTTNLVVDDVTTTKTIGVNNSSPVQLFDEIEPDTTIAGGGHPAQGFVVTRANNDGQAGQNGAAANLTFRRSLGTNASPSPLTAAGNIVLALYEQMFTTTGYQGQPQSAFECANAETGGPTATAQGTYCQIRSVGIGTTNAAGGIKLDPSGNVGIGHSFDAETVPFGLVDLTSVAYSALMQPADALGINATVNNYSPVDSFGPLTMQNTYGMRIYCQGTNVITGMTDALGQTFINGISHGFLGGRIVEWINIGSGTCTFTNEGAGSTAGNRYLFPGGQTLVCPPNATANFYSDQIQDSTVGRWRLAGSAGCHFELPATSVSHGVLGTNSSNEQGNITTIGANTSTALTYSAPYLNASWCTASPNGAGTPEFIVVTNSITAPTFSCFNTTTGAAANCVDLTYRCGGN